MDGVPVGVKDSLGFIGVMAGLIEVLEQQSTGSVHYLFLWH